MAALISRSRLLAASLGACGAGAMFAGTRTTAGAQTASVMKIGSGNVEPNAQVFYALDAGFFKKAGINAELTILRSGGVTMEAVLSNQLHAGVSNSVSFGLALLKKIPFVILAPGIYSDAAAPNAAIVIANGSTIKGGADFNGQTLGTTSLGGVDQLEWFAYLDRHGGDLASVKYVEVVPAAMAETVASGRIAGGIINDPELRNALTAGKVKKLVNAYEDIAPLYLGTIWFTTRDWLAQNKDTAKRFADAIVQAGTWAENNREQSLAILEKYTKFHEDRSVAKYGRSTEGTRIAAQVQPVFDAATKYKLFSAPLRALDYIWDGK